MRNTIKSVAETIKHMYDAKPIQEATMMKDDGKVVHDCAKHVGHKEYGKGVTMAEEHAAPDADGLIEWYDVMFDHGLERQVPTAELDILVSESHGHAVKKPVKEAAKLDPIGKEDADVNNDGKADKTDSYLKNRRKTIAANIKEDEKKDEPPFEPDAKPKAGVKVGKRGYGAAMAAHLARQGLKDMEKKDGKDLKEMDYASTGGPKAAYFMGHAHAEKGIKLKDPQQSFGHHAQYYEQGHSDGLSNSSRYVKESIHAAAKELGDYAAGHGGMDKKDFQTAAKHMAAGNHSALQQHIKGLDSEPRDKILTVLNKHGVDIKHYGYSMREETKQVDETSKAKALAYLAKAPRAAAQHVYDAQDADKWAGRMMKAGDYGNSDYQLAKHKSEMGKSLKRLTGIDRALKVVAKEEQQVNPYVLAAIQELSTAKMQKYADTAHQQAQDATYDAAHGVDVAKNKALASKRAGGVQLAQTKMDRKDMNEEEIYYESMELFLEALMSPEVKERVAGHEKAGNKVSDQASRMKDGDMEYSFVVTQPSGKRSRHIYHGNKTKHETMSPAPKSKEAHEAGEDDEEK